MYNKQIMSDNFRLVEALQKPGTVFTIYDYTKICYISGGFICSRQVVNNESKPSFIRIEHKFKQILGLLSFPNCLVLVDYSVNSDINVSFYGQEIRRIKVQSELCRQSETQKQFQVKLLQTDKNIVIIVNRECDIEIIVLSMTIKDVVGKAYLSGVLIDANCRSLQGSEEISLLINGNRVLFYALANLHNNDIVKLIQKSSKEYPFKVYRHCLIKEELIMVCKSSIKVYNGDKLDQQIEIFGKVKEIKEFNNGFIAIIDKFFQIFKKSPNFYDVKVQQVCSAFQNCSQLQISPQQDLVTFYDGREGHIYYCTEIDDEQDLSLSVSQSHNIQWKKIEHQSDGVKVFDSPQNMMVISNKQLISIYSPTNFQCYISIKATSQQITNLTASKKQIRASTLIPEQVMNQFKLTNTEQVECLSVHPCQSIVAIGFRNVLRVYNILYNEFKLVKEFSISHCKEVGFSNGGSMMHAKVGGRNGSKIYVYHMLQGFQLLEVLQIGRKIDTIFWSNLDNNIYAFHQNGYSIWGLQTHFKSKVDVDLPFGFEVNKVLIDKNNTITAWGKYNIAVIEGKSIIEKYKVEKGIVSVVCQNKHYIVATDSGELFLVFELNKICYVLQSVGQSFRLSENLNDLKLFKVKNNIILCLTESGDIYCLEWGMQEQPSLELITLEKKKIDKYQNQYKKYEQNINDLDEKLNHNIEQITENFAHREKKQIRDFRKELEDKSIRYEKLVEEKNRLQNAIEENLKSYQQETMLQVKQLEKIYERKLALTTNKLLTAEEMGYRSQLINESNLSQLEEKHGINIVTIREEYSNLVKKQFQEKNNTKQEIFKLKKHYETRISELEQENQILLSKFQQDSDHNITVLKKNVVNLELKYGQAVSQKMNLMKDFDDELLKLELLKEENEEVNRKLGEEQRRSEQLNANNLKMQKIFIEKDSNIQCLEKRIEDLQKSNEIFKYRIIEIKNKSDPKEQQIIKYKDNMIELEEEYDKITKKAHENQEMMNSLKKQNVKLKEEKMNLFNREKKFDKKHNLLLEKIRGIAKMPIQELRKAMVKVIADFDSDQKELQNGKKRSNSPLSELNRVREHLQICLGEAVDLNSKNEKIQQVQISKKNRQNSQLLKQINDLRIKIRFLEQNIKEKDLTIQEFTRGEIPLSVSQKKEERKNSTQFESGYKKTRESFFEKSMFKGHWKEKRLKTQQGSRQKKTLSYGKNESKIMFIDRAEDVDELKRLLEQKETIIKQLINKIHKLS